MDCEFEELGYYFGCEQCEACRYFQLCAEYDDFTQREDEFRDMARGWD